MKHFRAQMEQSITTATNAIFQRICLTMLLLLFICGLKTSSAFRLFELELHPVTTSSFTCTDDVATRIEMAAEACLEKQCTEFISAISLSYSNCTTGNNIEVSGGMSVVSTIENDPFQADACLNSRLGSDECKEIFLVQIPNLSSMTVVIETLIGTVAPTNVPLTQNSQPSMQKLDSPSKSPIVLDAGNTNTGTVNPIEPTMLVSTNKATTMSTTETMTAAIDSIQITFTGVQAISGADVLQLQAEMEQWFESYYNEEKETDRYLHHRMLQLQFRVPAVRNMNTVYDVTTLDTLLTVGTTTVTFSQNLVYDVISEPRDPGDYAQLPFLDTPYENELLQRLSSELDSFANLSKISSPVISTATSATSNFSDNDVGLSPGSIVGVAVAVIVSLVMMAGVGYYVGKQKVDRPPSTSGITSNENHAVENHTLNINEHTNACRTSGLSPLIEPDVPRVTNFYQQNLPTQSNEYVVTYKDQSRSVVGPTPIGQAISDPKNLNNDGSVIPIATVVPLDNLRPLPTHEA